MENFEIILKRELAALEERLEKRLEEKLDQKLDQKLEEKLEQKLEQKLDQKLEEKLNQKLEPIKNDIQEMKKTIFLIEHEHGRKIDAMYDFIMLEKEKREQQNVHLNNVERRVDRAELKIFDHENRIVVLEENLNSKV